MGLRKWNGDNCGDVRSFENRTTATAGVWLEYGAIRTFGLGWDCSFLQALKIKCQYLTGIWLRLRQGQAKTLEDGKEN